MLVCTRFWGGTWALAVFAALGFFAPCLCADDAEKIKAALARLDSPYADEREQGKSALVALEGDISRDLRNALAESPECVQVELFDVAIRRKDNALAQNAAAMVGGESRLALAARDYLLALEDLQLSVDEKLLDASALAGWRAFVVFRMRYCLCTALIHAQLKPGKYLSQFDKLRARFSRQIDGELLKLLAADAAFGEPLIRAASDRYALGADSPDYARNNRYRRLAHYPMLGVALKLVSRGDDDEEVKREAAGADLSSIVAAIHVLQELRIGALRALALSESRAELAAILCDFHKATMREQRSELLQRTLDQDALREEVEVTLARFGKCELLEARVAGLRKSYEREGPVTGEAAVTSRVAIETELHTRNNIAYLYLRSGDAKAAEREWQCSVDQAVTKMANSNVRTRSSLSSTLGAIYYNLACSQSQQNKTTKSLGNLRRAVEFGYGDFGWMLEDGDLENVRGSKGFGDWFSRVAPPALVDQHVLGR